MNHISNRQQNPFHGQEHYRYETRQPIKQPFGGKNLFGLMNNQQSRFQKYQQPLQQTKNKINIQEYLNKFIVGLQKLNFGLILYQEYKNHNKQTEDNSDYKES